MGVIVVDLFVTLDGVYQSPGSRDEDTEGGFPFGGWQGAYTDAESDATIGASIKRIDALLLGRKTYDIWAAFWPFQPAGDPIAAKFAAVPKFVASHSLTAPSWAGTTVVTDVAAEVRGIRHRFGETHVFGSGDLVRTLLREDLVDRINLWLYPIALGTGKRLFAEGTVPAAFALVEPPVAFPKGSVQLVYERAGEPVTGIDMSTIDAAKDEA